MTPHSSVGNFALSHDPHSSVGTPRTVPRPLTQVLGHSAPSADCLLKCWDTPLLSQDPSLKRCDTSHCPRTSHSSVGTPRTVPRPFVQVLGHLVLSQDPSLKRCDTSHCPRTSHSSVGTLRTVPRLPAQVLGRLVLSQDPSIKRWDTLHCPRTSHSSVGALRTVP